MRELVADDLLLEALARDAFLLLVKRLEGGEVDAPALRCSAK